MANEVLATFQATVALPTDAGAPLEAMAEAEQRLEQQLCDLGIHITLFHQLEPTCHVDEG